MIEEDRKDNKRGSSYMTTMTDFPKIQCPFIRKDFMVNEEDWKTHGHQLELRQPKAYLVTNNITPGFEWDFEDKNTNLHPIQQL